MSFGGHVKLLPKLTLLLLTFLSATGQAASIEGQIKVMQFNLHNSVFSGDGSQARAEAALMNKKQLDIIMTEENSTPDQQPRNLLNFGLDKSFGLCGGLSDASLFYNTNRWTCEKAITFDVTPNVEFGAGPRKVTIGVLQPKNPKKDLLVLAATSHWCVTWSWSGHYSYCGSVDHNPNTAHMNDAEIFNKEMRSLMAKPEYQNALAIFGGDLNSMSSDESIKLVEKMRSFNFLTANPYDASGKLVPSMGGTPDLIFYQDASYNFANKLLLDKTALDPMNHLSDHWGAIVANFNYITSSY